ncbi:DEAD/DEAH box helicase [Thermocrinis sp.]|jgi:superfamily II DNA or RNA helicase|uniref:DEAD/DEAH box helicase n=1 Tax=Thermocrinis sp. TaxID=2024383 RepID=UPI003C00AA15
MFISANLYGKEIKPLPWQLEAGSYDNLIISAPTGAGKSVASYIWAGQKSAKRIIFTAPTKSLSNERWLELKRAGLDVGLLTGDVRLNEKAKVLCMTQEIYTSEFAKLPDQRVIIDEVHYMFQDPERSRAYAFGIHKTHPSSSLLLLSATITDKGIEILKSLSGREMHVIKVKDRPVKIEFLPQPLQLNKTLLEFLPAIFFVFSRSLAEDFVQKLKNLFRSLKAVPTKEEWERAKEIAKRLNITNTFLLSAAKHGVGLYFGDLRYKERVFVEKLFRRQLIKAVVSSDALAVGVNFPAKSVVFCQLTKAGRPLTKREFLQMAGRAGRPGLWDIGYVGYLGGKGMKDTFNRLVSSPLEDEVLYIQPSLKGVLKELEYDELWDDGAVEAVCEEEAELVEELSLKTLKKGVVKEKLMDDVRMLRYFLSRTKQSQKVYEVLRDIYFEEFSMPTNFAIAQRLAKSERIDAFQVFGELKEKGTQREKLQFLKFFMLIRERYEVLNLVEFIEKIRKEDEFVLNPEMLLSLES